MIHRLPGDACATVLLVGIAGFIPAGYPVLLPDHEDP
jgi:hypothetical protein